jgi:hypothetical protein
MANFRETFDSGSLFKGPGPIGMVWCHRETKGIISRSRSRSHSPYPNPNSQEEQNLTYLWMNETRVSVSWGRGKKNVLARWAWSLSKYFLEFSQQCNNYDSTLHYTSPVVLCGKTESLVLHIVCLMAFKEQDQQNRTRFPVTTSFFSPVQEPDK